MIAPMFAYSQSGLTVGYNVGLCSPNEINRFIYAYNTMRPFLTKPMSPFKTFGGLSVGYIDEFTDGGGFELKWVNHHSTVSAQAPDTINNTSFQRDLKLRSNTLNIGGYGSVMPHVSVGGSMDFGNFKGFTRMADEGVVKDTAYTKIFQTEFYGFKMLYTLQMASTVFVQYHTGPVALRLFYQYQWMRMNLDQLDDTMIGQNIDLSVTPGDRFSNFGLELQFKLGGYN